MSAYEMPPLYIDHTVSEQKNAVNADTLPLQIKKTHHARVTFRQYRSIELSAAEPRIVLSCRHANLKMMFGGKKSVLPKTASSVALIVTEYNFKNIVRFVKKQKSPAARKSADCASGFCRSAFLLVRVSYPPRRAQKKRTGDDDDTQR